jgi:hypothetical protein
MADSNYSIVKKLIIAIGIIAAILAILISFNANSRLRLVGHAFDLHKMISMEIVRE